MPDESPRGGGEPQMPVSAPFEPPVTDMDLGLMEYIQPVPFAEAGPAEPQTPPRRGRDQFEFSPASMQDFGLMDSIPSMPREDLILTTMPIRGFDPSPAVEASPAVELAPESIPYMPQIVEPEAPQPAPVRRPKVPQPLEQPEFDQDLLQYLMMSEFGGPNLR
jgi:hypothetical protein